MLAPELKPGDVVLHEDKKDTTIAFVLDQEAAKGHIKHSDSNIIFLVCIKSTRFKAGDLLFAQPHDKFEPLDYDIFYKDKVIASNYEIKGS